MFMYARSSSWKLSVVVLLSAVFCLSGHAQLSTATSLAPSPIPRALSFPTRRITLTQTDTNFTRTFTTKDDGSYREEFLPSRPLQDLRQRHRLQDAASLGHRPRRSCRTPNSILALEIGTATETVTVSADVPLVNLASSTLGRHCLQH